MKPMIELDELVRKLDSTDEAERIYAAEDIGYLNRPEGVAPLLARLQAEPSRAVREAIFSALVSVQSDAVTEGAICLLASDDTFVRNQAVELLRQRGPSVIPFLDQAFSAAGKDERKMVVDVLAGVDGPGSATIYDRALGDSDTNVVITAVESLGNARKTEFRERIEQLLSVDNPMLLGACLETLAQIGNVQSLDSVRSLFETGGPVADFMLPSYLKLLSAHGDERAMSDVAGMLNTRTAHLQPAIMDAIAVLRKRHPSAELPAPFLESLVRIVRTDIASPLRYRALRLLGELAPVEEMASLLPDCPELDKEFMARREDSGV